jgi:hypothetical protein
LVEDRCVELGFVCSQRPGDQLVDLGWPRRLDTLVTQARVDACFEEIRALLGRDNVGTEPGLEIGQILTAGFAELAVVTDLAAVVGAGAAAPVILPIGAGSTPTWRAM